MSSEARIIGRKFETGFVIDDAGNILLQKSAHRGTPNSFKFTMEEQKLLEGNWLTHNHPSGKTFGPEDILTVFANKGAGVRAIGTENTYVMKLPNQVDGVFNNPQARAAYFDKQLSSVQASIRADVHSGVLIKPSNLTQTQYENWAWNEVWTRFAQQVPGAEYSVIKTNLPPRR